MRRFEKERLQRRSSLREHLPRLSSADHAPVKLIFVLLYVLGAILVWSKQDEIALTAETTALLSPVASLVMHLKTNALSNVVTVHIQKDTLSEELEQLTKLMTLGLTEKEACSKIEKKGLSCKVKYVYDWIGKNSTYDKVFTYAICKFHYDENGAIKAEQSLYKQIAVNRNYGVKEQVDTTYWQERIVYCLKDNNFDFRYSDTYKGYFVSLKMDTKKLFEEMPRAKVNVLIDLESSYFQDNNINIVGIDYNGFEDVEIDTLTIKGNEQTFYILDNSLHNSNLQTLEHSANIILDISENAINGEYVEVEL